MSTGTALVSTRQSTTEERRQDSAQFLLELLEMRQQADYWKAQFQRKSNAPNAASLTRSFREPRTPKRSKSKSEPTVAHWHADETGWKVFVKVEEKADYKRTLWVYRSPEAIFFAIALTKGTKEAEAFFGPDAEGILRRPNCCRPLLAREPGAAAPRCSR